MENKERDLFFMMGLNPKKIQFNRDFVLHEQKKLFISFKLIK